MILSKIRYLHYLEKRFLDQSIQNVDLVLKTQALVSLDYIIPEIAEARILSDAIRSCPVSIVLQSA